LSQATDELFTYEAIVNGLKEITNDWYK
jgi:hypothetical protein